MNTLAQQRVAALSAWFDRNSRWGTTPNGGTLSVGRYASIIPWNFETPPIADADPQALLFYASHDQCDGVSLADYDPNERIDTQHQAQDRLDHVIWRAQDATLPAVCIFPMLDPADSPQAGLERAGLAAIDRTALPVLGVPVWPLSEGARYRLARTLPWVGRADAPMPDMPADFVSKTILGVSDRWP